MKKYTLILFIAAFTAVFAQEKKYEVAVIGFYNLENLFDTEGSMQTINVDKLKAGETDYVKAEDFNSDIYYGAAWNSLYENVSISKSKTNYNDLPNVPTRALRFYKPKKHDYESRNKTTVSKTEFKEIVAKDPSWLSKKEFRDLIKNNERITINTNEVVASVNDLENTPTGQRQYTQELYEDKLSKLASVINQLGASYSKDGVALMGLAEIENRKVLEDLVATSELKKKGYKILQYDCMYSRGVDVALLYQEKYFEVIKSHTLQIEIFNDKNKTDQYYTRDILWVEGKLLGETVHVFVNHWPSRSGGEAKSSKNRELGAAACRKVIDELMAKDPNTQIILMGDLNDDPNNKSVKNVVGAVGDIEDVKKGGMYNPLYKDYKKGYGSLAYRGSWNLFDQVLISSSFVDKKIESWKIQDAEVVYNQDWITRFGGYEGGPNRSFGGNNYQGGYSDHLPSVVYLKRLAMDDKDKDGITDKEDDCPDVAGLKAFSGCPDTDEDGIMDKEDLCPEVKGLAEFKGCPDSDEDGVEDSKDDCPQEKGELENKGCPWADSDGDGVLDKDDKCPQTKGLASNKGCPEVKPEVELAIKAVFENLVFDTDKSTIKKSSDDELIALAKILKENPELLLTISGHTDNIGEPAMNMNLSKDRGYAAKDRLTSLGIEAARIEVFYFGETQPIASNETPEGKQANRRVVFEVRSK
jgi:outer membrane protein OmpA-like peptidoglycan-associated protein